MGHYDVDVYCKKCGAYMFSTYDSKDLKKNICNDCLSINKIEKDSWDYVIKDISARNEMGREKYGLTLRPSTNEDMLQHAYEEALDLVVYLKTEILKREANKKPIYQD